jgi:hypothetical protein
MGDVPASQSLIYAFDTNGRLVRWLVVEQYIRGFGVYSKFASTFRSATG